MKIKVKYIVNNYTLGARVKMTPTHKIISKGRLDERRTAIIYQFDSQREQWAVDKLLAYKGEFVGYAH